MKFHRWKARIEYKDRWVWTGFEKTEETFSCAPIPLHGGYYAVDTGKGFAVLAEDGLPLFGANTIKQASAIVAAEGFDEAVRLWRQGDASRLNEIVSRK